MLTLESALITKKPDWFYTYHIGNNIQWENDFEKENIIYLKAHYNFKRIYFCASYFFLDNYIYLDRTAHPRQLTTYTSLLSANLKYALKLRNWNFDFDLIYQTTPDSYISVPELVGSFSIYLSKSIFGNVAVLQPGIEVFYNTEYYADTYMPALRSFYSQNDELIGGEIYADAFLNIKIKRTLFFLRYQHANAHFTNAYYMTPGYPMKDPTFRFGLSWKFHD